MLIISVSYVFKILNSKIYPIFFEYSELKIKKMSTNLINNSIKDLVNNEYDLNDLFKSYKDSSGRVISIDIDTNLINKILARTSIVTEETLTKLEKGKYNDDYAGNIIYMLPTGILFNNNILYNIFPKIPVKMELVGDIICKLDTDVKAYGINNVLIKLSINVETELKILLPFKSKNIKVNTSFPIIIKIIEGTVPQYYFNGLNTPTNINPVS